MDSNPQSDNPDRQALEVLDAEDDLASVRDRFLIPDDIIYMNGNSLGPLTRDAQNRMDQAVSAEWGCQLIRGWNTAGWYDIPQRLGDKIGKLIGAAQGETTIADSTSINLFKTVAAALSLRLKRTKIVSEAGNFPTDLYMLDGVSRFSGNQYEVDIRPRVDVASAIDENTAVVVLTHVHYVSGEIFPMSEITKQAHDAGALVVWDLSHSAGAVQTDLNAAAADFAVGCGYKHLNGGPGAPAFIFAAQRHHAAMHQPLTGWFGHANPFEFRDDYEPATGVRQMLCGTTPVIGAAALEASVDLMLGVELERMYAKSQALSSLFQALIAKECAGHGLELASPIDVENRGAHISYRHEKGYAIMQNLISRGVIGDFRAPHFIRFGFSPLFMKYTDVFTAAEIFREILDTGSYEDSEFSKVNSVT